MDDNKTSLGSPVNRGSNTIPSSWHDENRQLFGAETTSVELKNEKCPHQGFLSRSREVPQEVQCSQCKAGWYFPLSVPIVDGKV